MPIQLKGRATRRGRKPALGELLEKPDPEAVHRWVASDPRAIRALFSGLFEPDPLKRWRIVWALGQAAAVYRRADNDEAIRDWIRRLLWAMNDESGATFWHAPEAVGEILFNVEYLIGEYLAVLGSFRQVSPFEPGVFWAMSRVAPMAPEVLRILAPYLTEGLDDPQPAVRAHAAQALSAIGETAARDAIAALQSDDEPVTFYDFGAHDLCQATVGALASRALQDLSR